MSGLLFEVPFVGEIFLMWLLSLPPFGLMRCDLIDCFARGFLFSIDFLLPLCEGLKYCEDVHLWVGMCAVRGFMYIGIGRSAEGANFGSPPTLLLALGIGC